MQFGLPVVATDVGDIGAIVAEGRTGRTARAGDVDALTEALFETLRDPDRCRTMGQAAIERAKQFTWDEVARRILAHVPGQPIDSSLALEPSW